MTFLDIAGATLNVRDEGPRGSPAVLLVHSLGTCLELWDAQAAALAHSYRVIRFDLRGHGLSSLGPTVEPAARIARYAADATAILDELGIAAAHVGGISIGGMIAMTLAASAPARVRSLSLFDTALVFRRPEQWRERAAIVRAQGVEPLVDTALSRWVSPAYAATPAGRGLRAILRRTSREGYAAAAEALAVTDLTGLRLSMPALVVVGERDPSSPPAVAEALAETLTGSKLVVIPGAYHVPLGEYAETVNATMLEHLKGSRPDGAQVRREVLGADHVQRASAATTMLDRDFQAFITKVAWGEVWARPHFDRRTRSIVTLALLAGLGREDELALHIQAMQNTGTSEADLTELLLHVAVYAGIPAANAAMRVAKRVLAETP